MHILIGVLRDEQKGGITLRSECSRCGAQVSRYFSLGNPMLDAMLGPMLNGGGIGFKLNGAFLCEDCADYLCETDEYTKEWQNSQAKYAHLFDLENAPED